jgi:hypothetical protein
VGLSDAWSRPHTHNAARSASDSHTARGPQAAGKIDVDGLNFYYGARRVLENICVSIRTNG